MDKAGINGSLNVPTQVQMVRTVIQDGAGKRLVYTQSNGMYVGSVYFECMTVEGLKAMLQDAQNFIAEATGGVAVATQMPPGSQLKPS